MNRTANASVKPERRYDIDWLRVVAMGAVFFFHCARFFNEMDWHLKNAEQSFFVSVFTGLLDMWMMQLFFLLAGVASWYALRSRSGGQYLVDRVKRLLVPLYTVGMIILIPPQLYFELASHRGFTGTYWELLQLYVGDAISYGINFKSPFFFNIFWGHLWFLHFLFIISLVTLPLLLYLRSDGGRRVIERLAGWCDHWGGIFLFLIPLVVRIAFRSFFEGNLSWADLVYYALFFLAGYVIPADQRFTEAFKRHSWISLAMGIAGFAGVGFFIGGLDYSYPSGEYFSWAFVMFQIAFCIANWGWVAFLLSVGAKYLNFNNKALAYANEALLPFYILHQTIILTVGWFVIPLDMGILPKFIIISVVSFVAIMVLYELLVRRFNVVRFFFGMRPKRKPPQTPARSPGISSA